MCALKSGLLTSDFSDVNENLTKESKRFFLNLPSPGAFPKLPLFSSEPHGFYSTDLARTNGHGVGLFAFFLWVLCPSVGFTAFL